MTGWRLGLTAGVTSAPQPDVPGPSHTTLAGLDSESSPRTREQDHSQTAWLGRAPTGLQLGSVPPQAPRLPVTKPRALPEVCLRCSVGHQVRVVSSSALPLPCCPQAPGQLLSCPPSR